MNNADEAAEFVEGRGPAKGNAEQTPESRTPSRTDSMTGLQRVRAAASREKNARFTALLHHVTLEVDDADAAATHLRECGIEPFGGPRVSYDWKEMFIHPKSSGGVLFQLFEQLDEPGYLGGPPKKDG